MPPTTLSQRLLQPAARGLSLAAWGLAVALTLPTIGLLWDGAWHMSFGRDTFWSPPHILLYAGVTLSLLLATGIIVAATFRPPTAGDLQLGALHAPLGAFWMLAGTTIMLAAAPFDDWWHNTFGRDTGLWSPPHIAGLIGGSIVALGAISFLRNGAPAARLSGARYAVTLILLGDLAVVGGALALGSASMRVEPRASPELYPITSCLAGAFLLTFAQRVTGRAGSATLVAVVQFGLIGSVGLIFSASGYDYVVSLPPLLIAPALVLDLLFARWGRRSFWPLIAGVAFPLVFFPAEAIWFHFLNGAPEWWQLIPAITAFFLALPVSLAGAITGEWLGQQIGTDFVGRQKAA
jgi:hypothetical protein